jgi:hypothetical protein
MSFTSKAEIIDYLVRAKPVTRDSYYSSTAIMDEFENFWNEYGKDRFMSTHTKEKEIINLFNNERQKAAEMIYSRVAERESRKYGWDKKATFLCDNCGEKCTRDYPHMCQYEGASSSLHWNYMDDTLKTMTRHFQLVRNRIEKIGKYYKKEFLEFYMGLPEDQVSSWGSFAREHPGQFIDWFFDKYVTGDEIHTNKDYYSYIMYEPKRGVYVDVLTKTSHESDPTCMRDRTEKGSINVGRGNINTIYGYVPADNKQRIHHDVLTPGLVKMSDDNRKYGKIVKRPVAGETPIHPRFKIPDDSFDTTDETGKFKDIYLRYDVYYGPIPPANPDAPIADIAEKEGDAQIAELEKSNVAN